MKDKYDLAAELRQKVLDYANEVKVIDSVMVSERFGISLDHANRTMRKMQANDELKRIGRKGPRIQFNPTKTTTKSAELMRQFAHNQISKGLTDHIMRERDSQKKVEPWRTVHIVRECDKPIPSQGGQGAVRREFGIQASAGML